MSGSKTDRPVESILADVKRYNTLQAEMMDIWEATNGLGAPMSDDQSVRFIQLRDECARLDAKIKACPLPAGYEGVEIVSPPMRPHIPPRDRQH